MPLSADFLTMLTTTLVMNRNTGSDQWGNETWGNMEDIVCYILPVTQAFGGQDGHNKKDGIRVKQSQIITDAYGIKVKDRIKLPTGEYAYVTEAETFEDQFGEDLFQQVTVETTQKG